MNHQIYPLKDEIKKIKKTDWELKDLWEFLVDIGFNHYGKAKYDNEKKQLTLVTGGWSGNEEIIRALQENIIFWNKHWESTHRGGLYIFDRKE